MATRQRNLIRVLVAVVLLPIAAAAQQRPNFNGTWIVVVPEKSAGKELVVKHDDRTLVSPLGRQPVAYQLDGTEVQSQLPMSGDVVRISTRAGWEKDRIVIRIYSAYPNRMKTVTTETWSLDSQGRLVIDIVEIMEGLPNKPDIQQLVLKKK